MQNLGIFNTSIGSGNLGDQIIMDSVLKEIGTILPLRQKIHFSSHDAHLYNSLKLQQSVVYNLLCGTNCLGSQMWYRPSWAVNLLTASFIKPTITLGVGWGQYQKDPDLYTKSLLKKILINDGLLSVRDNYTKEKLESAGFKNILNTACLTMWNLDKIKCINISQNVPFKSSRVVYTLTDYAKDIKKDLATIKILLNNYEDLFIWLQGSGDFKYLNEIINSDLSFFNKYQPSIKLVPPILERYDQLLDEGNIDYVGTRLHGGIRALQKNIRTIIIGVDNRALEKKKDFNIPVISREAIDGLDAFINAEYLVDIKLPTQNIIKFKNWLIDYDAQYNNDCIIDVYTNQP